MSREMRKQGDGYLPVGLHCMRALQRRTTGLVNRRPVHGWSKLHFFLDKKDGVNCMRAKELLVLYFLPAVVVDLQLDW